MRDASCFVVVEIEGEIEEVEGLPKERLERSPPAFVGEPGREGRNKLGPCLPGTIVEEEVDNGYEEGG